MILWSMLALLNAMQTIELPYRFFVRQWSGLSIRRRLAVLTLDAILLAYAVLALAAGVGVAFAVMGRGFGT